MPSESRNIPEQEASIKSREHELFVKPDASEGTRATKPFLVYLARHRLSRCRAR